MHPIAHIIAKFGATIGMDGLETENGVCTLRFDDVTVTLECAENDGALYLYLPLEQLDETILDRQLGRHVDTVESLRASIAQLKEEAAAPRAAGETDWNDGMLRI